MDCKSKRVQVSIKFTLKSFAQIIKLLRAVQRFILNIEEMKALSQDLYNLAIKTRGLKNEDKVGRWV